MGNALARWILDSGDISFSTGSRIVRVWEKSLSRYRVAITLRVEWGLLSNLSGGKKRKRFPEGKREKERDR
jgi:hypothetical protein